MSNKLKQAFKLIWPDLVEMCRMSDGTWDLWAADCELITDNMRFPNDSNWDDDITFT